MNTRRTALERTTLHARARVQGWGLSGPAFRGKPPLEEYGRGNTSQSQRRLDTIRRPCTLATTSRPSDSTSYFVSTGLPSNTIVIWQLKLGSLCSMQRTGLRGRGDDGAQRRGRSVQLPLAREIG